MFRDISLIQQSDCIVVTSDTTIDSYDLAGVHSYTLLGNKYLLTSSVPPSSPPTSAECFTVEQAQEFPSVYDGLTPFYHLSAILVTVAIFYVAYRILIYPFFRRI